MRVFPGSTVVKNSPAMQETRAQSLGQKDTPGVGNDNPFQYSCLENSMDRGAWLTTVHGAAKELDMAEYCTSS